MSWASSRRTPGGRSGAAATLGVIVYGTALGAWWLVAIGMGLGVLALSGLVFEYYKGEHAH